MKNMIKVPQNESIFGLVVRVKAKYIALHLLGLVTKKWIKQINEPSNSIPNSEESVTGLNKLQNSFYDVFATRNKEIPEPRP
jgi:hypothetical protein